MKHILNHEEPVSPVMGCDKTEPHVELPPLIDYQSIKDYERLYKPAELARAVFKLENESVLIRRPLRWTKDGVQLPEARANMELVEVCELYGWKIVTSFGSHFAIVAPLSITP